jgi:hypothetical protein
MNLRVQSGRAHSRLTLNAFSISIQPSTTGKPAMKDRFKRNPHRPVRLELPLQFPARSPTEWRVGRFNLWKQVQKETSPVDFTNPGA